MELYGTDDKHDFWWDGPPSKEQPRGLWNITAKGDIMPLGGYHSKMQVEREWHTWFDNPRMRRA